MKRKIYVVGNSFEYANWMQGKLTKTMEEADLVVFTGGEDVNPVFYNEPVHPLTSYNTHRDTREIKEFEKALMLKKPMIGICRGSQFLCVMNYGKLVQHQENRYSSHPITLKDGSVINISSTHHQAAFPFDLPKDEYDVLGWGNNLSSIHENGLKKELSEHPLFKECEIVYYPKTQCLGIQGHPEYKSIMDNEAIEFLQTLLTNFINNNIYDTFVSSISAR